MRVDIVRLAHTLCIHQHGYQGSSTDSQQAGQDGGRAGESAEWLLVANADKGRVVIAGNTAELLELRRDNLALVHQDN